MSELLTQVSEICDKHQLPKRAFVIDDEWEQREAPDPVAWEEFVQVLSAESSSLATLTASIQLKGYDFASAVPVEIINQLFLELGAAVTPLMSDAREQYVSSSHVLQRLELMLKELKFEVESFSAPPDFGQHPIPSLLIVDYHLTPESEGGTNAQRIFTEVMRQCRTGEGTPPPFVILMSQKLLRDDRGVTLKLAERSGFFRFNYEFLHKEDIKRNPETFYLTLLNFFRHAGLSRAYFQQLIKLEEQTRRIAAETTNRFFQITPAEVSHFRPRTRKEGLDMATVLTDLYSEHVFAAVSRSAEVKSCMFEVDRALSVDSLPVWDVSEGGPLHRLYSDLLFVSTSADESFPPRFGDIYEAPDKSLRLVISQECDLACGEDRLAKARTVLMLSGRLNDDPPGANDGGIVARPLFTAAMPKVAWIWWDLLEPHAIPYRELYWKTEEPFLEKRECYRKILKLRALDAEEIQQQFASKLTRVGSDILPGPIKMLTANVQIQPAGTNFDVDACALRDGNDWSVALLRPAQLLDVPREMRTGLTVECLVQLGVFSKLKEFKSILKRAAIAPLNKDQQFVLGFGNPRHWQGTSEWSGPQ
jgi:hypothetical protein